MIAHVYSQRCTNIYGNYVQRHWDRVRTQFGGVGQSEDTIWIEIPGYVLHSAWIILKLVQQPREMKRYSYFRLQAAQSQ